MKPEVCKNCGAAMYGKYCSQCGQKKFDRNEFTTAHFFKEAVHVITHFDSKIFKAIKYLFTRPGFLTKEFSSGRIKSYIHPITLFFLLNAFFFFIGHGLFNIKDADYNYYKEKYPASQQIFTSYQKAHDLSEIEVAQKFNSINEIYRKSIYFIIIPLFGIGLQLIFIGRRKVFMEFLVQAIHTFCWYVLTLMVVVPVLLVSAKLLGIEHWVFELVLLIILSGIALLYNYKSIKRIFTFKSWLALVYALPATCLMIFMDGSLSGWLNYQLSSLHFRF